MPVISSNYSAPGYLFSRHLQTILPALFRRVGNLSFRRDRIITPDNDFLDLDWSEVNSRKLAILSHGLEGNTSTGYIRGMTKALNSAGMDVLAWNYRGCSGEINRQFRFYHSGETEDLDLVISHAAATGKYTAIVLVGFSIGGNITLKYLGEKGKKLPLIKCAVTFSVPCHLESGAKHLAKIQSWIYMRRFIQSLRKKVRAKALIMPDKLDTRELHKIRDFLRFDEIYTAPIHGFESASDYWHSNSSINFIKDIRIPSLIVNALNDPFLPAECYPLEEAAQSEYVFLEMPQEGGHCGFYTPDANSTYWSEKRAIEFINNYI